MAGGNDWHNALSKKERILYAGKWVGTPNFENLKIIESGDSFSEVLVKMLERRYGASLIFYVPDENLKG